MNTFKINKYKIFLFVFSSWLLLISFVIDRHNFDKFTNNYSRSVEFSFKNYHNPTKISDKLLWVTFDIESEQKLKKLRPTIHDWFELLAFLETLDPKAIIFDKILEYPEEIENFPINYEKKLTKTFVPVSNSRTGEIAKIYRKIHNNVLNKSLFNGKKIYQFNAPHSKIITYEENKIRSLLHGIGSFEYIEDGSIIAAHTDNDNYGLFHYGLASVENIKLESDYVEISGDKIPLIDYKLPINFIPTELFDNYARTRKISYYKLLDVMKGEIYRDQENFESFKDSTILVSDIILSNFYSSPIGDVAESQALLSVLNSVRQNNWIKSYDIPWYFVIVMLAFSVAIPLLFSTYVSLTMSLLVGCGIAGFGLILFSDSLISFGWLYLITIWFFSSFSTQAVFLLRKESLARRIRFALTGIIPFEQIEKVISSPQMLDSRAREQRLTIMFVDIIGFSLVSEHSKPEVAIKSLKDILSGITRIIHRYHGVVDKTLGDGILCFFGEEIFGDKQAPGHELLAVECAVDIQRFCVDEILKSDSESLPPFPVRIGINTCFAHLGNIGDERRFDLTVIGSGVNFASRLEGACEAFRILVGKETYDAIDETKQKRFHHRLISIKHHSGLFDAYEFDPFYNETGAVSAATKVMRDYHGIVRKYERFVLPESIDVTLEFDNIEMAVRNFSLNGLEVECDRYFAKNVPVKVSLRSNNKKINTFVRAYSINNIDMVVCWGRAVSSKTFVHGLKIISLSDHQRQLLFDLMKNESNEIRVA